MDIQAGDRVRTEFGVGVAIHPKDNPEDGESGLLRSDAEFIDVRLDQGTSQPALHGQIFTTRYVVVRRGKIQAP